MLGKLVSTYFFNVCDRSAMFLAHNAGAGEREDERVGETGLGFGCRAVPGDFLVERVAIA